MRAWTLPFFLLLLGLASGAWAEEGENAVATWLRKATEARAEYELREAERWLRKVHAKEPAKLDAALELVSVLDSLGEGAEATALLDRLREAHPKAAAPLRATALMALDAEGATAARTWIAKAEALAPKDPGTLLARARIELRAGEVETAGRLLDAVEAAEPAGIGAMLVRARWLYTNKETDKASRLIQAVLAKEPTNLSANSLVAGGFVREGQPLYRPPWTPVHYDRRIKRARKLYRAARHAEAEAAFATLDTDAAHDGRPPFYRGIVALRTGRTKAAMAYLARAVAREPENFMFRYAWVRSVMWHVDAQRREHGGGVDGTNHVEAVARVIFQEADVPGIERFVIGYERLLPRERQVVLRAVRPFAAVLPKLIEVGATHTILDLDERLGDADVRRAYREGRTKDGRWLTAMRGVGGRHAATGLEFVIEAGRLGDDVFTHELAHQIHRFTFDTEQNRHLDRLYAEARFHDRALTPYARRDASEYFAVAYDAFVNVARPPWHHKFYDRATLKRRDPKLYAYLLDLTGMDASSAAPPRLRQSVLAFYEAMGHAGRLADVRALFSEVKAPR